MLAQLFAVMAPVLTGAGLGFGWVRLGYAYPVDFVTRLVFNIGTPALVLASLTRAELEAADFGRMLLAALLVVLLMAMLAFAVGPLLGKSWRVIIMSMMHPNTGNMGLPVVLFAFGDAGFALGITVMVAITLVQFSFGTLLISSGDNPLKRLARTPALHAVALAVIVMLTDITLPLWLRNTLDLISGFTVPLMLITLGVSLANIQIRGLRTGLAFVALRIPLAAVIAWAVGALLDLPPLAHQVLVLQMCMPVAVFNYLFAQRGQLDPSYVASLIFCSTLLAFIYLPILLALMM
jgi:predicted permease